MGDIHNLKRHCGHFNTTHHLKIQAASNSRPLEPGKRSWVGTRRALPASFFLLRNLHSPVCDMHSRDEPILSHYCLMIWPMVFPRISSSCRQVFLLLKFTLHMRTWPGPTQCHCHIHLHEHTTVPFPTSRLTPAFPHPSQQSQDHKNHLLCLHLCFVYIPICEVLDLIK